MMLPVRYLTVGVQLFWWNFRLTAPGQQCHTNRVGVNDRAANAHLKELCSLGLLC
jgi:hypothetical protein